MDVGKQLKNKIRTIPHFPKRGILFKDITPAFSDPELCLAITAEIGGKFKGIDAVAGIESRGFFWGMGVAQFLKVPFIPIRKAGKLPAKTISVNYALEYGTASLEVHADAIESDWQVLIHDDLLATGGTAQAAAKLVNELGNVVGFSFLVELTALGGRKRLMDFHENIDALVSY